MDKKFPPLLPSGEVVKVKKRRLPNPMKRKGRPSVTVAFVPVFTQETMKKRRNKPYVQSYFMTRSGFVFKEGLLVYMRSSDGHWYHVIGKTVVMSDDNVDVVHMEVIYGTYFSKKKGKK